MGPNEVWLTLGAALTQAKIDDGPRRCARGAGHCVRSRLGERRDDDAYACHKSFSESTCEACLAPSKLHTYKSYMPNMYAVLTTKKKVPRATTPAFSAPFLGTTILYLLSQCAGAEFQAPGN